MTQDDPTPLELHRRRPPDPVRLGVEPPPRYTLRQALVLVHGRARHRLTLREYQTCIEPLAGGFDCGTIRAVLLDLELPVDAGLRVSRRAR